MTPDLWFMCEAHWYVIPSAMRERLLALYRPGQEIDKSPSLDYLDHAQACIERVAEIEEAFIR